MEHLQREAWANPSSLHGPGLVAAEALTRFRLQIAACLGAEPEQVIFTSGATESVHLALLGAARQQPPGRMVISALEHPAVEAAADQLTQRGWTLARWPVECVCEAFALNRVPQHDKVLPHQHWIYCGAISIIFQNYFNN